MIEDASGQRDAGEVTAEASIPLELHAGRPADDETGFEFQLSTRGAGNGRFAHDFMMPLRVKSPDHVAIANWPSMIHTLHCRIACVRSRSRPSMVLGAGRSGITDVRNAVDLVDRPVSFDVAFDPAELRMGWPGRSGHLRQNSTDVLGGPRTAGCQSLSGRRSVCGRALRTGAARGSR